MDDESFYHFTNPTMELEGNSEFLAADDQEESLSQSISLPSLPVSIQEQLIYPEISSTSTKNQVPSMKEIDEKLNALRRENFDLKLRLYCSTQNKGFPRFGEKYFTTSSTQTDGIVNNVDKVKPPKFVVKLSQSSQTATRSKSDCGAQTDEIARENKTSETDKLVVSSVSIQTEAAPLEESVSTTEKMTDYSYSDHYQQHFKQQFKIMQSRLIEQLNPKPKDSPRQTPSKQKTSNSTTLSASKSNHKDSDNLPPPPSPQVQNQSSIPKVSHFDFELSLIANQSPSILKQISFQSDKTITPLKSQQKQVKNVGFSECECLADEIDSRISMLTNLVTLNKSRDHSSINQRSSNRSNDNSCDVPDFIANSHSKQPNKKENQAISKQFDNRSTSKIYDIINRQTFGPVDVNKKHDDDNLPSHGEMKDINQNLVLCKPPATSKRLSRICDDSENHHFVSPDLGIGDSDQDLNSDLKAYIPLGYYQLLRCNLHQLSSHLNYLDNLYRDCFVLQSISLSEYSTEMKPSLTHLNQTINSSRNICKNFTIEDENSISLRLDKIKAKKESMEKAITRQLKKTDKLLRKAKANLKGTY